MSSAVPDVLPMPAVSLPSLDYFEIIIALPMVAWRREVRSFSPLADTKHFPVANDEERSSGRTR